jgi:hypothetical protein
MASPPAPSVAPVTTPEATPSAATDTETDDHVRCAQCRAELTSRSLAVKRAGAHEHTFRNPAGYSWTIACYRDAAGCRSVGALTTEASWFPGYAWCYARCARCGRHIGWWFVGDEPSFVGLIVTRLAT